MLSHRSPPGKLEFELAIGNWKSQEDGQNEIGEDEVSTILSRMSNESDQEDEIIETSLDEFGFVEREDDETGGKSWQITGIVSTNTVKLGIYTLAWTVGEREGTCHFYVSNLNPEELISQIVIIGLRVNTKISANNWDVYFITTCEPESLSSPGLIRVYYDNERSWIDIESTEKSFLDSPTFTIGGVTYQADAFFIENKKGYMTFGYTKDAELYYWMMEEKRYSIRMNWRIESESDFELFCRITVER